MSDWLDDFQMMGTKLNEGEKSLMRFAMKKEQQRIIKLLLETPEGIDAMIDAIRNDEQGKRLIALIKGEF